MRSGDLYVQETADMAFEGVGKTRLFWTWTDKGTVFLVVKPYDISKMNEPGLLLCKRGLLLVRSQHPGRPLCSGDSR